MGLRAALLCGMALMAAACGIVAISANRGRFLLLLAGLALTGAGLALPYATAPRLALSALAPDQAGKGSGMINACTFLAGSMGVALGAIADAAAGFYGVLAMLAAAAFVGIALVSLTNVRE